MRIGAWVGFVIALALVVVLVAGCASQPSASTTPAATSGDESKAESFAERERARVKREQEGQMIDERREDFIHRQNGRSGE